MVWVVLELVNIFLSIKSLAWVISLLLLLFLRIQLFHLLESLHLGFQRKIIDSARQHSYQLTFVQVSLKIFLCCLKLALGCFSLLEPCRILVFPSSSFQSLDHLWKIAKNYSSKGIECPQSRKKIKQKICKRFFMLKLKFAFFKVFRKIQIDRWKIKTLNVNKNTKVSSQQFTSIYWQQNLSSSNWNPIMCHHLRLHPTKPHQIVSILRLKSVSEISINPKTSDGKTIDAA